MLYYDAKRQQISNVSQREDRCLRFDYEKVKIDYQSALIGGEEKIRDSR